MWSVFVIFGFVVTKFSLQVAGSKLIVHKLKFVSVQTKHSFLPFWAAKTAADLEFVSIKNVITEWEQNVKKYNKIGDNVSC